MYHLFVFDLSTWTLISVMLDLVPHQIVSYLLDLPEKDEEEVERAQINNYDTLWGETGGTTDVTPING